MKDFFSVAIEMSNTLSDTILIWQVGIPLGVVIWILFLYVFVKYTTGALILRSTAGSVLGAVIGVVALPLLTLLPVFLPFLIAIGLVVGAGAVIGYIVERKNGF